MSLEVKVPTVGESVNEVTIAKWTKNDGDMVELDEVICELESDKATFEVTAEQEGKLHIKAEEGETLEIGALLAEIDTDAQESSGGKDDSEDKKEEKKEEKAEEKGKEKKDESKSAGDKTGEVKKMTVPSVGESINEVTVSSWTKSDGDYVEMDEVIAEIESDKATFELTAEAEGYLKIVAEEGETIEIGAHVCDIEVAEGGSSSTEESEAKEQDDKETESSDSDSYAQNHPSPAAMKIMAERGIDPSNVNGTGKGGRITKQDALEAEEKPKEQKEEKKPEKDKKTEEASSKSESGERNQRREKLSNLRKTISRRLVSVKNETAMLTTFNEVDMKPVMDLRKKYKEQFKEKYEVNLGFMSFFTKACCMALQEFPAVNAMIDGDEMIYNDYCDVSIAVSAPKGLMVPVIRNAEKLSFHEIEKKVIELATKAKDSKLSIEEMQGGTFTITNGGIFGSMLSTPIINSPQSAILGMHNIVERAVVIDGEVKVRPIMYVALSYDHRIIDGRESVRFLYRVKELIEDPQRILLGI